MDKIVIEGGYPLNGEISISGAKNSAIKLMAVCLLTDKPVTLKNMPRLRDTRSMAGLLTHLGVEVDPGKADIMKLHAPKLSSTTAPYDLVRKMRASFNVLGPLLAREEQAKVSLPGGCAIGARPVDLHLKALEALGANIELDEGYVIATAKGETVMYNSAREPEIVDLANCLNAMGAKITGAGRSEIRIEGVTSLKGVNCLLYTSPSPRDRG